MDETWAKKVWVRIRDEEGLSWHILDFDREHTLCRRVVEGADFRDTFPDDDKTCESCFRHGKLHP
jgi:hypothetical protein